jgi:ABC-2 type transport system permease protein/sodium transport system permease protein
MVAVCGYARTFKEAQNYIMPVILAALIPAGVAALPGTELSGVNTVVPVMNMVLMARQLLLGHFEWGTIMLVMLSTSFYAVTAVVIASRIFSTEAVVFADSASLRSVFTRRLMRPAASPSISLVLIVVAMLFPTWMFVQFAIQPGEGETVMTTFRATALLLPLFFVALPVGILAFFKVDLATALSLGLCRPRYFVAAVLIGVASWVPAHELFVLQNLVLPVPKAILESDQTIREAFANYSIFLPLLLIALAPAICEEMFFRGFLSGGLKSSAGKWVTILVAASIFAVFHFLPAKFAVTAGLGVVLGYICWNSRSVWPAILAHLLHNASAVVIAFWPPAKDALGLATTNQLDHLPAHILAIGGVLFILGLLLSREGRNP